MKKILILLSGNILYDARVSKEIASLRKFGYSVVLVQTHKLGENKINDYPVYVINKQSSDNMNFTKIWEIVKFSNELNKIIKKENPAMIFHLGDLVNGTFPDGSKLLLDVLTKLDTLEIPIYFIPGNHDREYLNGLMPKWKQLKFITPLQNNSIQVSIPSGKDHPKQTNIFFAHDLNNNYRVRDQYALSFVNWIKGGSNLIKPEDWLIIGHTHCQLISFASKAMCVGQFSPEINIFGYSIIDIDDSDFALCSKYLPGKIYQK